ncbi:MAG: hypothetical protein R3B07_30255 [Polyangiaceae bacterium]
MVMLGVPYGDSVNKAEAQAREQAKRESAYEVASQGGPKGLGDKQVIALIAYLQRLGTDIEDRPTTSERSKKLPTRQPARRTTPPASAQGAQ